MNIQWCEHCGKDTEHELSMCTKCGRLFSIDELIADNQRKAEIIKDLENALQGAHFILGTIQSLQYYTTMPN